MGQVQFSIYSHLLVPFSILFLFLPLISPALLSLCFSSPVSPSPSSTLLVFRTRAPRVHVRPRPIASHPYNYVYVCLFGQHLRGLRPFGAPPSRSPFGGSAPLTVAPPRFGALRAPRLTFAFGTFRVRGSVRELDSGLGRGWSSLTSFADVFTSFEVERLHPLPFGSPSLH